MAACTLAPHVRDRRCECEERREGRLSRAHLILAVGSAGDVLSWSFLSLRPFPFSFTLHPSPFTFYLSPFTSLSALRTPHPAPV